MLKKKPKLTFTTGPDASSCGCVWRRTVEFGDVIVKQCREHARQGADQARKVSLRQNP